MGPLTDYLAVGTIPERPNSSPACARWDVRNFPSTVNVVRKSKRNALKVPEALAPCIGNSHDVPSLFASACKNHLCGCQTSTPISSTLRDHEAFCPYAPGLKKKAFQCTHCPFSYDAKQNLKNHERNVHGTFVPQRCRNPKGRCDPNHVFQSREEPTKHRRQMHYGKGKATDASKTSQHSVQSVQPVKCSVPGCKQRNPLKSPRSLRAHLRLVHRMTSETAGSHWPQSKKTSS